MDVGSSSAAQEPTRAELAKYAADVALYRVAYDEATQAIKDQVTELDGIRQRLISFLAFIGSATAFLAGSSITATASQNRSTVFYCIAGLATLLLVATIYLSVNVLNPAKTKLARAADASTIIGGYIETDIAANEGFLLRNLALHTDNDVEANRLSLAPTRQRYFQAVLCGASELVVLIALVWFST